MGFLCYFDKMYSIIFYVPPSHLDMVKNAMFEAGAGRIGQYDCCCWQTLGTGQYRPLQNSQPFQGQKNEISQVDEYKVELVCEKNVLADVINALLKAHPYETPAYSVLEMHDLR